MAEENPKGASDLDRARTRMESAVNRLESAVAVRSKESKDAAGRSAAELAAAREEISRLKSDHQSITQKLDATIDRIRAVLGE